VIADTAQETVEKLSENLEQIKTELQSVRVNMNGHFKTLEPRIQEQFDAMEKRIIDAITGFAELNLYSPQPAASAKTDAEAAAVPDKTIAAPPKIPNTTEVSGRGL